MPSQYRSTDTLIFGGGLKVKRKVFGTRKSSDELWDIVRKYVRRHGRHRLLRIADIARNLEQQQSYHIPKQNIKLPRYILESNINLYDVGKEVVEFKDEFSKEVDVDKNALYQCAVHTALLPFPFEGAEGDDSPSASNDALNTLPEKKKRRGFGFGKKKKKKSDDLLGTADGHMADIPFDLPEEVLRMRVTAGIVSEFKRRSKGILHQLQKRTKMFPEEELLGKCLGAYYDILEKSGRRLEGRRIYDLIRVFMKTVKEHLPEKAKPKDTEPKERFCWQYFEKLAREVTEGDNQIERTTSETLAWVQSSRLDSQALLEWLKNVFSWNVIEHRKLVDAQQPHALKMGIRGLQLRLKALTTDASKASQFASPNEFKSWLDNETAKVSELINLFSAAMQKQPQHQVIITASTPVQDLYLTVNGTLSFKSESGWSLGSDGSLELALWNDKDAVGKTKGSAYLGTKSVAFAGQPITADFKGVQLTLRSVKEPVLEWTLDQEDAYRLLLEKCIELDATYGMGQGGENTLSRLSEALLYIYALRWGVSDSSRFLAHVEYLFPRYVSSATTLQPLYLAFQIVAEADSAGALIMTQSERARWGKLLVAMERIFRYQVVGYRQVFPYNTPENELDQMLYMLKFIYEHPLYRAERPDCKDWDAELNVIVQLGAVQRFQILHALATPVVSNQYGRVLEMLKLLMDELNTEQTYFSKSFQRHSFDHVEATLSVYVKYLSLEMDYISQIGRKCWKERRALPSPLVFTLYETVKMIQSKIVDYSMLQPYIQVSRWFAPFVFLFLEMTSLKAKDIILNAIKLDDFEAISDVTLHSSSVLDVFTFFHQTADWLKKLQWPDEYYRAKFSTRLGALYCDCIDLYAERLKFLVDEAVSQPDISDDVKKRINNMETARSQLDDLSQSMNIEQLQEILSSRSPADPPLSPESPAPGENAKGVYGNFEIKVMAMFKPDPKVFGLSSGFHFNIVHPSSNRTLASLNSGQIGDIGLSPPTEGLIVELHYANAISDVLAGKTYVTFEDTVGDHDVHEFSTEIIGIGKVNTRVKKLGDRPNDIEFYFRRTFRSLKRIIGDALFTRLILPMIEVEIERLLENYARRPMREPMVGTVYRSNPNLFITDDVIGQELNELFDKIGDNLGFLSNHLYEDLMKQYIKKLWRDLNLLLESKFILSNSRFLTIKQLTVLVNTVETFKLFFYGDGDMLSLRHFDELAEYKRSLRLIELYPLPTPELIKKYEVKQESELLAILKLRGTSEEMAFVMKNEEERWNKIRGTSV